MPSESPSEGRTVSFYQKQISDIYSAIRKQPGLTVQDYATITQTPATTINNIIASTPEGKRIRENRMVARPSRGKLPAWGLLPGVKFAERSATYAPVVYRTPIDLEGIHSEAILSDTVHALNGVSDMARRMVGLVPASRAKRCDDISYVIKQRAISEQNTQTRMERLQRTNELLERQAENLSVIIERTQQFQALQGERKEAGADILGLPSPLVAEG